MSTKNAKPKKEAQRRPSRKAKVKATLGEFDLRDYRNVEVLKRCLSETGQILPRRRTGLSAKEIATEALRIAAEVDLYTSGQVTVLTLGEA